MAKKTLFILIGIGVLMLAVIVFLFIGKMGKSNNNIQPANQPPATLPATSPTTLPTETGNNQQNIQDIQSKIKDSLISPPSQQAVKEGVDSVDFKDASGNKIPLTDFEKATGTSVNGQLGSYLDNKDYEMYYCPSSGDEKNYAMYFGYNVSKAYGNLYPDTLAWMKDWEKTILPDLHAVLFPGVNFSDSDLNQSFEFKDGKYRYAEIRLPGGKTGSINYHVSDNGVIISASPACLDKLVQIYEPVQP